MSDIHKLMSKIPKVTVLFNVAAILGIFRWLWKRRPVKNED